jgi:hypothetical protein
MPSKMVNGLRVTPPLEYIGILQHVLNVLLPGRPGLGCGVAQWGHGRGTVPEGNSTVSCWFGRCAVRI